jgi:hypothetical protein
MKKYLITFGIGTKWRGDCVIITASNEDNVREYVYDKYGQWNVAAVYDYETSKSIIDKYNYEIIEEINL